MRNLELTAMRAVIRGVPEADAGRRGLLLGVGAGEGDRGEVPVQPGGIHPERGDGRQGEGSCDLFEVLRQRVQCPPQPIVVQEPRRDAAAIGSKRTL